MSHPVFEIPAYNQGVRLFGVRLVGVSPENGVKLLMTLAFVAAVLVLARVLHATARLLLAGYRGGRALFWVTQIINVVFGLVLVLGVASIWFENPTQLATALGLFSAGLAFALQKVVTSFAGYFVILRGRTFNVGDRIVMGGVRGDVIALGFMQTTIMEMGQPPPVQTDEPAMWVKSRQYTGRIVTVPNSTVFNEPVYNYSRDFPFICEEISLPVPYNADYKRAEEILLQAARRQQAPIEQIQHGDLDELKRRYFVLRVDEFEPRVYYRMTDNWLEMTVRFVTRTFGVRDVKDAMSREIIAALNAAGISVASSTFEIVGLPPVKIQRASSAPMTAAPTTTHTV